MVEHNLRVCRKGHHLMLSAEANTCQAAPPQIQRSDGAQGPHLRALAARDWGSVAGRVVGKKAQAVDAACQCGRS